MPPTIHFGKIETLLPRALTSTLIASSSSAGNPTRSTRSGGRCLLFTSHRGTTRASTENKVRQVIGSEVRGIELFDFSPAFVAGEPSIESGVEAMRIINRLKPATVVAAGGASVMSLAKYACNRTNTPGNLRDLILIPTVSCAGEEVIDGFHAIDWRGNEVCLYDDASSDFRANRIVLVDESIGEMDEIDSRTDFLATMHSMSYILDPTAARKQKKTGVVVDDDGLATRSIEMMNDIVNNNATTRWTPLQRLDSLKCSLRAGEIRNVGVKGDESLLSLLTRALMPTFPLGSSLIRVCLFRALLRENSGDEEKKIRFPVPFPGSRNLVTEIEEMLKTGAPEASPEDLQAMYVSQIDEAVNEVNEVMQEREQKARRLPKTAAERQQVKERRKKRLLKLIGIDY